MKCTIETLAPTKKKLAVSASASELAEAKAAALAKLGANVRLAGFRAGKAPTNLVEKSIDQNQLQSEVLDSLINQLYAQAANENKLRPVANPEVSITKFVPFTTLEFTAEVEVVGDVKLTNYKLIKLAKPKASVAAKEITDVLDSLNRQNASRKEVTRAAKLGDEVTLDFKGRDAGTNQAIAGASGEDYPLTLGSGQFIPGFEEELVGLRPSGEKEFTLTFPADYGVTSLQNKKVTFAVTIKKVNAVELAKLDDAWAKKTSPFKSLAELKADIRKQVTAEKQRQLDQQYQQDLINKISEKSTVAIPKVLIDEEIERLENDEKQNLAYRGQTFDEHLAAEKVSAEEHKEQKRPAAEARVKASLVLTELADREKLTVTNDEVDARLAELRAQYGDRQMQAELAKAEARNQIAGQILTEKTLARLVDYASI